MCFLFLGGARPVVRPEGYFLKGTPHTFESNTGYIHVKTLIYFKKVSCINLTVTVLQTAVTPF